MVRLIRNISLQMFLVFVCCRCVESSNGSLSVCEENDIITLEASLQETFTYKICIETRTQTPQVNLVTETRKGYLVGNSTKYALSYARSPEQFGRGALTLEITNMTVDDFVKYKIVSVAGGKEDVIFTINLVHSGCPEHWCSVEQGRCLMVIKRNASCTEAKGICASNNGTLYDGTFNYRSRHCSRMNDLKTVGGTECSKVNNSSETNQYSNTTKNSVHVSHFACFRDLPFPATPTYNNNHVFQDIKYLWIGVGLMFISLMTYQIIAHRKLLWDRAAEGLANKRRIRGKLGSIFYWDSSLVSGRETAGANDSIELIDFKDHSEVVEEEQSCEQETYYEIVNQESRANFGDTCLRTNDGTGRGNHVTNMAFASGVYAVISERFNSQRSLDGLISDTRERAVHVRAQSAETVDCRNPDFQIEALGLKTLNSLVFQCNEATLNNAGARTKPKFRKFSNVALSDKTRGDEATRDPGAGNRYIKKSNNASQFSHFGENVKVDRGELKPTRLRSHEDSDEGFTSAVQNDDRTCASSSRSSSDISNDLLPGHEVAIDGAAEEVYSKPESFSEDHDYGSLTGYTVETGHGDCLLRSESGSSLCESAGQAGGRVEVGVDLPIDERRDAVSSDTLTSDFVMSVPVEGKYVLSDGELSGEEIDADADNADDYWIPDGYGNRISAPNFDEFNENSMMAGEQEA